MRGASRRALTLLELMAVVTLLALAIGFTTIQVHGVSDVARLRAAASQIESVYRLAHMEAKRSGQPRRLEFNGQACTIHRMDRVEGVWQWSRGSRIELVRKVRVVSVEPSVEATDRPGSSAGWSVVLGSGAQIEVCKIELGIRRRVRAKLYIDEYGSRFELMETDSG